ARATRGPWGAARGPGVKPAPARASPARGRPEPGARPRARDNPAMATGTSLSDVFPLGSRVSEQGRLEVGGCDVIELAREFGTPAYVYAEDDMRARARAYLEAFRARVERFEVIYASKAFPCTAVYRLFAEDGLAS